MNHPIPNNQDLLAELLLLHDVQIQQLSYEAVLKIKRWKFIMRIPGIGDRIKNEADANIDKTFFAYVSNSFILIEEGYFFSPSEN